MKHKLCSLVLCMLLILSASACTDSTSHEVTDNPNSTTLTTTATTTESPEEPPVTQPDPLLNEKNAIKEQVIAFINSDAVDPDEIFDQFLNHDYYIGNFDTTKEPSSTYHEVYRKDGVLVTHTNDGTLYTVTGQNQQVTAEIQKGKLVILETVQLEEKPLLSIFYDFGFDIDVVYTVDKDSVNLSECNLTPDMMSISDDLATCTFSEEYLINIASLLFDAITDSEEEHQKLLDSCQMEGIYSVADRKATFRFQTTGDSLGEIIISSTFENKPGDNPKSTSFLQYTTLLDGVSVQMTNELLIEHESVSFYSPGGYSFRNIMTAEYTKVENGIPYDITLTETSHYVLRNDGDFIASWKKEQTISALGQSTTNESYERMTYDSASHFTYSATLNHQLVYQLDAYEFQWGSPDKSIPQAIIDLQKQLNSSQQGSIL